MENHLSLPRQRQVDNLLLCCLFAKEMAHKRVGWQLGVMNCSIIYVLQVSQKFQFILKIILKDSGKIMYSIINHCASNV